MTDILIKGMELPKEGSVVIEIYSDGVWCDYKSSQHHAKAIELPPHDDLVSRQAVIDTIRNDIFMRSHTPVLIHVSLAVNKLPAIVEASN